ncbi:unnamed protein product [Microthlaspi erraticum]|uniref:Uncharacterized protein n=1 Tax=Microthlaspi erraticum TaxID=1685480 RepID=A0A6D2J9W4_9BRAS|nr:unnamed protein product [Microthlaspi erraticum]
MLQLTPTNCAQRPRCAPGSSPPDGVSQGHFNLTPHSRLGLALIPNYNAPTAPPGESPTPSLWPAGPSRPVGLTPVRRPVRYFREALMTCLLSLQSTPDLSPCFGLTHTVSETTSRKVTHPSTTPAQARLTGVTYRPLTEKVSALC